MARAGIFKFLLAIRQLLGLRLQHVIFIGVFAFAVFLLFFANSVYEAFGPVAGLAFVATAVLSVYRRLVAYAGYGTPPLPSTLQPKLFAEKKAIRCVVMSDTHNMVLTKETAESIPDADIFLHAGDFTVDGSPKEFEDFNKWLGFLKHKNKVVIAGNHDLLADPDTYLRNVARTPSKHARALHDTEAFTKLPIAEHKRRVREVYLSNATHYLDGQSCRINVEGRGAVTICGTPCTEEQPGAYAAAFAINEEQQLAMYNRALPPKNQPAADILLTHGPARNVLDRTFFGMHVGSLALSKTLVRLANEGRAPTFLLHGHLHETRGVVRGVDAAVLLDEKPGAEAIRSLAVKHVPTTIINAASVNLRYDLRPNGGAYVVFDIPVEQLHGNKYR